MIIWPSNSTAWVFFIPCCLHQAASALISTPRRTPGEWRKFPWLSGPHNGWLWKIPFKMDDFYGVRSIYGKPRVFWRKRLQTCLSWFTVEHVSYMFHSLRDRPNRRRKPIFQASGLTGTAPPGDAGGPWWGFNEVEQQYGRGMKATFHGSWGIESNSKSCDIGW